MPMERRITYAWVCGGATTVQHFAEIIDQSRRPIAEKIAIFISIYANGQTFENGLPLLVQPGRRG